MTVKLIKHTGECERERDPALPCTLDLTMRAPEFMHVAFICLHGGTEEVVAQADNVQELRDWMKDPRLSRYIIHDAQEVVEDYDSWT